MTHVDGETVTRFAPIKEAFLRNFSDRLEYGASVAVVHDGELVAHLWGGHADQKRTVPWRENTLANVWSVTKGIVAIAAAMQVERGTIRYDDPIARLWPEFAAAGKDKISLDLVMSHRAGLDGLAGRISTADMLDWNTYCGRLAAMAPNWEPGSRCAYHALSYGHLVGEPLRRATGLSVGALIKRDVCAPLDADFHVGLPAAEHARVAEMIVGPGCYNWVKLVQDSPCPHGCLYPEPDAETANTAAWRMAEVPGGNGHGDALSLARIYGDVAGDNSVLLSAAGRAEATRELYRGPDCAFGMDVVKSRGFSMESPNYGPRASRRTFGHGGWGGSLAFGDPDARLGFAYVTNHMCGFDVRDPRSERLVEAVYDCLQG